MKPILITCKIWMSQAIRQMRIPSSKESGTRINCLTDEFPSWFSIILLEKIKIYSSPVETRLRPVGTHDSSWTEESWLWRAESAGFVENCLERWFQPWGIGISAHRAAPLRATVAKIALPSKPEGQIGSIVGRLESWQEDEREHRRTRARPANQIAIAQGGEIARRFGSAHHSKASRTVDCDYHN